MKISQCKFTVPENNLFDMNNNCTLIDLIIQTELEVAVMAAHTVEHHSVRKLRIAYGHPHDRCQK